MTKIWKLEILFRTTQKWDRRDQFWLNPATRAENEQNIVWKGMNCPFLNQCCAAIDKRTRNKNLRFKKFLDHWLNRH